MLVPLLAAITIHWDFEGGSLAKAESAGPAHFRAHLAGQTDRDGRNRQANWYYFRIDGARGQDVVIDLVNLPGEYNYKPNRGAVTKDTVPVWSEDQRTWTYFASTEYEAAEPYLRLRAKPRSNRFWIAHVQPYTLADLDALMARAARHPHFKRSVIGKSVEGRDLYLATIANPAASPKKSIWLMFRQHCWETGSSFAGEGAIDFLLSDSAAALRREFVFRILPAADPDGLVRGAVRFNRHGFDLNRNWDVEDAVKMPEIAAQRRAMFAWLDSGHAIDILLSLHNTETSEYLEGPPDPDGAALLERVALSLNTNSTFAPTRKAFAAEATTTAGKVGRMTVNQGLWRDRKINAFIIEQRIDTKPSIAARKEFGAGLVRALAAAAR